MDRTEYFLALITYLLASVVYVTGNGNTTPQIIVIPVLIILYGMPLYLLFTAINDVRKGVNQ